MKDFFDEIGVTLLSVLIYKLLHLCIHRQDSMWRLN